MPAWGRLRACSAAAVLVALALTLPTVSSAGAAPALAEAEQLAATATPNQGRPGDNLQVVGSGWPGSAMIQLTTCGGLAIEGSVSCDLSTDERATTTPDGRLVTSVRLGNPPTPCPCVVHVVAFGTDRVVNIPVSVTGHPVAPLPVLPPEAGRVLVASTSVADTSSWKALFGAAATGDLVLVLRNTTASPQAVPPLKVELGRLGSDSAASVPIPALEQLPASGERTYRIPFKLDPGIGGNYLLRGSLEGAPSFTTQTSHWAWGFFVVDALLVLLLIIAVFWRIGRSRGRARPAATTRPKGHRAPKQSGRRRASKSAGRPAPSTPQAPLAELFPAE